MRMIITTNSSILVYMVRQSRNHDDSCFILIYKSDHATLLPLLRMLFIFRTHPSWSTDFKCSVTPSRSAILTVSISIMSLHSISTSSRCFHNFSVRTRCVYMGHDDFQTNTSVAFCHICQSDNCFHLPIPNLESIHRLPNDMLTPYAAPSFVLNVYSFN